MGDKDQRTVKFPKRLLQRLLALQIKVVCRLVQNQRVGVAQHQKRHRRAGTFPAGKHANFFVNFLSPDQDLP